MPRLTENHFSFKCPMSWDTMEVSANGRYCGKCRKEVFDLTNCSLDEVSALQRKHGSICGSIRVAAVAVSLTAAACQNTSPPRTTGTPRPVGHETEGPFNIVAGGISPLPSDSDDRLLGEIPSIEAKKQKEE